MTKEPSAGERYRHNLSEMKDHVFVEALQCVINPMDEELMRQLCLEAVDRLAAIRDSNAELVECLERSQKELERLLKCKWGNTFCFADCQTWKMNKEALARHNADKGEV